MSPNSSHTKRPPYLRCPETTERAWKYFIAADNRHQRRTNYFLVAESMLLFSFITAIVGKIFEISFFIAITGIMITSFWYYVNAELSQRIKLLKEKYLEKNDPVYWDYSKSMKGVSANKILSHILPNSIIFLWASLLLYIVLPVEITFKVILIKLGFSLLVWMGIFFVIYGLLLIAKSKNE